MPFEIKIYTLHDPERSERVQLDSTMEALGFIRQTITQTDKSDERPAGEKLQEAVHEFLSKADFVASPQTFVTNTPRAGETEAQTEARRERGQPSPGKARRTKAEIAEDEAADAMDAETLASASGQSQIGEPEPETAEEQADAAQDAADETAETEANGGLHPRERLRKALGALGMKAGVEAVRPGGILGMTVDMVPAEDLEAAIAKLEAAKSAPSETKADATVEPETPPATKDDLMATMLDYAQVYDGTRDPKSAKLAAEDCGKVFQLLFGETVQNLSTVPSDGYGKAIAGIQEAIEKNPFKREVKR